MSILTTIQKEIKTNRYKNLATFPSYAPNQESLLDLVNNYWINKFRDGDWDGNFKRSFYNIVVNPSEVASKMIDLDTKDIRIISEDGQSPWRAWLFQRELKMWMKENLIGKLLNDIVFSLPKYGHIILKKVGLEPKLELLDLSLLIANPTLKCFLDAPIIEKHLMTKFEIQEMKGWKNQRMVFSSEPDEDGKYLIYERYDPRTEEFSIVYPKKEGGTILFEGEKENPYREHKWENIPARSLGRGIVERLLENQIVKNDVWNMFCRGLQWSSKKVFQTRDETLARNLLTNVDNGEVLRVLSEITPISMEERNLVAYNYADQKWDINTRDTTFSQDIIRGERPPAGTPLGTSRLQALSAGSYYDLKREELGLFIKEIILKDIIPAFKKKNRGEHLLNLIGDTELDKLDRTVVDARTDKKILASFKRHGTIPSQEEIDLFRSVETSLLKKSDSRPVRIPDSYYENFKFKVDVLITEEQIDMGAKLASLQTILQIVGSNPAVFSDPRTKKILDNMLNLVGISPVDIETPEQSNLLETMSAPQRGGSIAKTSMTAMPTPMSLQRAL